MSKVEITHFHLFCGIGGGAMGFNEGQARVGQMEAEFRCLGGVDNDPAAIADFSRLTGSKGTVLDLFSRGQYVAWHGHEPPEDWREATPDDIRRAAGNERPNIGFTSSPCKGLSGLLSQDKSKTAKYQALNELTLRGIWLMLEAWADDPLEFILFENVPRIATRGRHLLDQICGLLHEYGYATAETVHDCGVLGGLAQSRKRFLLVARHVEKVPPFLYEPRSKPLRGVGEVIGSLPMPGDEKAGPMHRIPRLQWKTWVRLALVEAGKDWRSLERLNVVDGMLADYGIVPGMDYRNGCLGVRKWDEHTGVVAGRSTAMNGAFSVADPRLPESKSRHNGIYRVVDFKQPSHAVTGTSHVAGAAMSVNDPRAPSGGFGKYRVTKFDQPAGTILSGSTTGQGAFAVADPRPGFGVMRKNFQSGGHYGVVGWVDHSYAVTGSAKQDTGRWSVADPRIDAAGDMAEGLALPDPRDQGAFIIQSMDNTWHRPFTTLELAALQFGPDVVNEMHGGSDSGWRERIGNAVPRESATAIASVMGQTLLLAWSGQSFVLDTKPIWVQPIALATAVGVGKGQ